MILDEYKDLLPDVPMQDLNNADDNLQQQENRERFRYSRIGGRTARRSFWR